MPSRSNSNVTVYHQEIRQSVEEGGGHRAAVNSTRGGRGRGDRTGILRIDFQVVAAPARWNKSRGNNSSNQ